MTAVLVGTPILSDAGYAIQVGADDWQVMLGCRLIAETVRTPVAPAFAAAEGPLFKHVFEAELAGMDAPPLQEAASIFETCSVLLN